METGTELAMTHPTSVLSLSLTFFAHLMEVVDRSGPQCVEVWKPKGG